MFPRPAWCVFSFGRKSSSSNRNNRRVLCLICLIIQPVVKKIVENYCFSRVSEGTLGSFWARFWRRSVLQGHCVSLSGRVRFQLREEEQQQQQEQQEGSMSHCTNNSTKTGRKVLFFHGFRRDVRQFLGSFLAPFRPLCFPVRQGAFSASGGRAAAATGAAGGFYVSYVSLYNQWDKNWSKTIVFLGFQKGR